MHVLLASADPGSAPRWSWNAAQPGDGIEPCNDSLIVLGRDQRQEMQRQTVNVGLGFSNELFAKRCGEQANRAPVSLVPPAFDQLLLVETSDHRRDSVRVGIEFGSQVYLGDAFALVNPVHRQKLLSGKPVRLDQVAGQGADTDKAFAQQSQGFPPSCKTRILWMFRFHGLSLTVRRYSEPSYSVHVVNLVVIRTRSNLRAERELPAKHRDVF